MGPSSPPCGPCFTMEVTPEYMWHMGTIGNWDLETCSVNCFRLRWVLATLEGTRAALSQPCPNYHLHAKHCAGRILEIETICKCLYDLTAGYTRFRQGAATLECWQPQTPCLTHIITHSSYFTSIQFGDVALHTYVWQSKPIKSYTFWQKSLCNFATNPVQK